MKINTELDCTPMEFLEDLVNKLYGMLGYKRFPLSYFLESQHPTEMACLQAAEEIFEMITGDSPEYTDLDEDGDEF